MNWAEHDVASGRGQPQDLLNRRAPVFGSCARQGKHWGWLWLAAGLLGLLGGALPSVAATNSVVPYTVRAWQTFEGLPHNSVWALAQSSDGYLWVGTQQGLARFDGLRFTLVDEPAAPELKRCHITALCAARDGSLWIGCASNGVIHLKEGKFSRLTEAEGLPSNQVNCLLEDHEGALWVGSEGGLTRYARDGSLTTFTTHQQLRDNSVRGLCEERSGVLQVATRHGLSSLSKNRVTQTRFFGNKYTENVLHFVRQDRQGNLWTGSNDGLYRVKDRRWQAYGTTNGLPAGTVNIAYEDHAGQLWVGTYKGLVRMVGGQVVSEPAGEALIWDKVYTIFEDRERNLWVGAEDGLYRLTPARFSTLTTQQGLSDNNVMSVCEDRSNAVWIATYLGGVNRWQNGRITVFNTTNGLTSDKTLSLREGRDGSLWVGMEFGGLNRFQTECSNNFPQVNDLLKDATRVIYEDRQGGLWIGSTAGLNKWLGEGRFAPYTQRNGLLGGAVMAICDDAQSNLWVGTETGLSRLRGTEIKNFTVKDGLSDNWVNALYVDREQTLWIGTRGGGLNRYKDGVFKAFTTKQGLFSDVVYEIVEDDNGFFWMTCRNGLFRVARKELEAVAGGSNQRLACRPFGKVDGLLTEQFNGVAKPAGWKGHDGRLWFSTIRGVVAVDPRIETNDRPPPVAIEKVVADRKVMADFKLGVLGANNRNLTVEIPPGRGDLEIEYRALSLQVPEKNRFKYMLEGFDSRWTEAGTDCQAHYLHLSPGQYVFRLQACNNDGVWNEPGATLTLVLQPHFWQTWWFKASIVLAVGLLLTVAYRVRMARLQAIERLRVQIAANLHDDVGARLTKMAMVTEFADRETAEADPSKPHLRTLSKTTREIIQAMDEIVWTINPKNDNLDDLANYIFQYTQEYFQNTNVSCRLDFPAQLPNWPISTEARHNLFMVVKEAFNNVLKHAAATEVQVSLTAGEGKMTIIIADNGVGFDPEQVRPGGNGLENMRQRLSRIGGRLVLESHPGQGTRIRLEAKGG